MSKRAIIRLQRRYLLTPVSLPAFRSNVLNKISYVSGNVSTATGTEPSGTVENDIIIVSLHIEKAEPITLTVPSGWSNVFNGVNMKLENTTTGENWVHYLFWIRRGATAPDYTWSWTGSYYTEMNTSSYYNTVLSGDPFGGVNDIKSNNNPSSDAFPVVSGTTQVNNELLIWEGSSWWWQRITFPIDFTTVIGGISGINGSCLSSGYKLQTNSGSTGTISVIGGRNADSEGAYSSSTAMLFSLKPINDVDVQAFINAVGTLSYVEEIAITNLVKGLKTNGTWNKYKAIYPMIGGTASSHKWNLKDPRDLDVAYRLVFNGTVNHSANGAAGNGSNGYAETFFNPTLHSTYNNVSLSFYSRTTGGKFAIEFGYIESPDVRLNLHPAFTFSPPNSVGSACFDTYSTGSGRVDAGDRSGLGYYSGSRISSSDSRLYENGVQIGTTQTGSSPDVPNGTLWLLGCHFSYGLDTPSDRECAFATIGDGFTDTEVANDYTIIQAYQTALGRQI